MIQERDILRCTPTQVTFRYRDSATGKNTTRVVGGAQFLWLVLQHVLPRGFRRSRNFGVLHPNFKHRRLLDLLRLRRRPTLATAGAPLSERPKLLCRCCGAAMVIVLRRIRPEAQGAPGRGCGRGPGPGATESAPPSARPGEQTQERTLH